MSQPLISLRYPATCQSCDRQLAPGEHANWDSTCRRATCATCLNVNPAPVEPAPAGRAGESAQTVRDRSRAARKDRARKRWGTLGGLAVDLSDDTHSERAWAKGAKGERIVARRLEKLLAEHPVLLLHDRRIPGTRANIDHLAIGPGGVTIIDAKHFKGTVRRQTRGGILRPHTEHLLVNGRDRTTLIDGMHRQLHHVRQIVGEGPDVQGLLCLVDAEGLPLLSNVTVNEIPVTGTRAAAKLACRPGSLNATQIAGLRDRLASTLPAYTA